MPSNARSLGARKAWRTMRSATYKARKVERASKEALREWARLEGWHVVFFEGKTGSPRTGIDDAVLLRIAPRVPDKIQVRLVQLKAGSSGLTADELRRIREACSSVEIAALAALHDGEQLHLAPLNP